MQEARIKLFSLFVCTNFQLPIFRYRPIVIDRIKEVAIRPRRQANVHDYLTERGSLSLNRRLAIYLVLAMQSISTKTFFGKVLTATQERAGRDMKY